MNDPARVNRGQALGQRRPELTYLSLAEWSVLLDGGSQRRTRNVGRRHPWGISVGVRIHDQGGVESADLAGGRHLAGEPPPELRVLCVTGVDDLDRHLAVTWRRAQEHPAHATFAQAAQQTKRANPTGIAGLQPIHPPTPWVSHKSLSGSILPPAARRSRAGNGDGRAASTARSARSAVPPVPPFRRSARSAVPPVPPFRRSARSAVPPFRPFRRPPPAVPVRPRPLRPVPVTFTPVKSMRVGACSIVTRIRSKELLARDAKFLVKAPDVSHSVRPGIDRLRLAAEVAHGKRRNGEYA